MSMLLWRTITLSCDSLRCAAKRRGAVANYTHTTVARCKREARVEGWQFARDGKVYCPSCKVPRQPKAKKPEVGAI